MADTNYEINAGFFDAIDEDRTYSADDINRPYRRLISEGIFATAAGEASDDFQILTADDGMNVIVSAGDGLLGEKWVENPSDFLLTISSNSETLTRIDSIILQVDTTQSGRVGNIVYRTGTASSSPVHPDINTEDDIYELRLADITVSPSCTAITQALITDCRGSDECPWITSLIYQVDTSTLYAQWQAAYQEFYDNTEAEVDEYLANFQTNLSALLSEKEEEFDEWFENIKDQLSEDSAGNLQLQINDLYQMLYEAVAFITTEDGEYLATEDEEMLYCGCGS